MKNSHLWITRLQVSCGLWHCLQCPFWSHQQHSLKFHWLVKNWQQYQITTTGPSTLYVNLFAGFGFGSFWSLAKHLRSLLSNIFSWSQCEWFKQSCVAVGKCDWLQENTRPRPRYVVCFLDRCHRCALHQQSDHDHPRQGFWKPDSCNKIGLHKKPNFDCGARCFCGSERSQRTYFAFEFSGDNSRCPGCRANSPKTSVEWKWHPRTSSHRWNVLKKETATGEQDT